MKIYAGFDNRAHNAEGLLSFEEDELGQFLIWEVLLVPEETGFPLAKEKILKSLQKSGLAAIWTENGTVFFLSEQVVRKTAGNMLADDFFSVASRRHFVDAVVADMKRKGL